MGECYRWVNIDRKECITPWDFGFDCRLECSSQRKGEVLNALRDLMTNEWKGCRVFWMGDESLLPEPVESDFFAVMKRHCDELGYGRGGMSDTVYEAYKNVSCLFKAAEERVRENIQDDLDWMKESSENEIINEYGIDFNDPFAGMFQREGAEFRFTVNTTKRVAYSFETTKIFYSDGKMDINMDDGLPYFDPLPDLLGYGRNHPEPGEWIGDIIEFTDELPEGVSLLDSITFSL